MTDQVLQILNDYHDNDVIDDRREYSIEDHLLGNPELTLAEATTLYNLVQDVFTYPEIGTIVDNVTPDQFKEYFVESLHNGWEGFTAVQIESINVMIRDIGLGYDIK